MPLAAEQPSPGSISVPVVVIVLLIGATIFGLGYARAVMVRALTDFKATKAAVPGLRKAFWKSTWTLIKIGFVVSLIAVAMGFWVAHDVRTGDAKPQPSPSHSSKPKRRSCPQLTPPPVVEPHESRSIV